MSKGFICRLEPLAPAQLIVTALAGINAAFPAANILDRQPKTVCQSNPSGAAGYDFVMFVDLLADTPIDTIAVMFTNLSSAAGWDIRYANSATGPAFGTLSFLFSGSFGQAPTTRENRRHGLLALAAPVTARHLRIALVDSQANSETVIRVGALAIGLRLEPESNFELGSGRKVEDQSISRTLPGGETATEEGGKTPLWRGTWSNLSEAEMREVWSILTEVGISKPVLIVEDAAATTGQAEAMHYGQLTSIDFTERVQLEKQRIDVTIRELV